MIRPDKHIFVQLIVSCTLSFLSLGGGYEARNLACEMLIAIDEPLYRTIYNESIAKTTDMAEEYIKKINRIYQNTFLTRQRGPTGTFGEVYFRLREVRILFNFCTNPRCNESQYFLDEFEKIDTSDFCLAHLFTYRDFPGGIQGLGYKKTVCREKWNKGFTTLLNHKILSTMDDSAMTFSHEVGHNFGAVHDEDTPESYSDCRNRKYIMSSTGSSARNLQFSRCSLINMTKQLDEVLIGTRPHRRCLVRREESYNSNDYSFCGNGIREGFEECDCGLHYMHCYDPCCYAAEIDPSDLLQNVSAVPCRKGRMEVCLRPYNSILKYGFYVPLIFIGVMMATVTIFLCWDWRSGKRITFGHVDAGIKSDIPSELEPTQNGDIQGHKPLVEDRIGLPKLGKENGTICNGTMFNSHISPRIGNSYVKRPEPVTVACTSSSASPSSLTASQTVSFFNSDKECSSISSSIIDPSSDRNSVATKRKQDALFNEMLQKAPKHPQRDLKECVYLSKYVCTKTTSLYNKTNFNENEEDDIDLIPKRRAPLPPNQATSISSTIIPEIYKVSPVKRPTEPPPPAPNIVKMGSSFR